MEMSESDGSSLAGGTRDVGSSRLGRPSRDLPPDIDVLGQCERSQTPQVVGIPE